MRCYSHLSDDEREQIGLAKAVGHSIGAIAKAIGRPKSTVSRELFKLSGSALKDKRLKRSVLFIGRVRREVLKYFVVMTRCEFIRR
jgi:DNA-binding transcriptional ArsR family regulator